jgi:hypothetical protein
MAAVVIKEVAGTMAIITIIIKIYMKQNLVSNWPAPPVFLFDSAPNPRARLRAPSSELRAPSSESSCIFYSYSALAFVFLHLLFIANAKVKIQNNELFP